MQQAVRGRKTTEEAMQARQSIRQLREQNAWEEGFTSTQLAQQLNVSLHVVNNALNWLQANESIVAKAGKVEGKAGKSLLWKFV